MESGDGGFGRGRGPRQGIMSPNQPFSSWELISADCTSIMILRDLQTPARGQQLQDNISCSLA